MVHTQRSSISLTQEERPVRIAVHEAWDWGTGRLVEGVKPELGMIGKHGRLHGQELPEDCVVPGILPVNPAQDVGAASTSAVKPLGASSQFTAAGFI
jgi:hypothetical protein